MVIKSMKRVTWNKGATGVGGITVEQFPVARWRHWPKNGHLNEIGLPKLMWFFCFNTLSTHAQNIRYFVLFYEKQRLEARLVFGILILNSWRCRWAFICCGLHGFHTQSYFFNTLASKKRVLIHNSTQTTNSIKVMVFNVRIRRSFRFQKRSRGFRIILNSW